MSELMQRTIRALAALFAGTALLAAGNAPEFDADLSAPQPSEQFEAPPLLEEPFDFAEPAIGPIFPEADSLPALVRAVASTDGLTPEEDRQFQCLATAVYFEARGEPLEGQLAVAEVILNRVASGRFGATICDVVKAPRQFSFVRGGQLPQPSRTQQWDTARAIAGIAKADAWDDVAGSATHFHATRVNPGWRLQRITRIGNHIFYR